MTDLSARECRHGHVGWSRRRLQFDARRGKSYWILVCDECIRISTQKQDAKRPNRSHTKKVGKEIAA